MPLLMVWISASSGPNSRFTSSCIDWEQAIRASDSAASHHSTEWTCRFTRPLTHPLWRPASVAWMVLTSGTSKCSASAIAGWATSQSWAWTTSGIHGPSAARVFESPSLRPARSMECPIARVQAIMSSPNTKCGGSSAAAITRTPSSCASVPGWVRPSVPPGCRDNTTTSCPARESSTARWWTCRPSPPTTTGGYSHDTIRTFIAPPPFESRSNS